MERSNTFQIVIISVFVVLVILGFLGFSGKLPLPTGNQDVNYGTVTLWGTVPQATMDKLIGDTLSKDNRVSVRYTEKKKATFNSDFVEALARGSGPDLIFLSQDNILKTLDKLSPIPPTVMSERDFRSTFLPEGELFLRPNGIVALPITIDPLVMFWNRDIFTNALLAAPPTLWTQFYDLVPKITVRAPDGGIMRSLVSFGEYRNVSHAKDLVALLLLQAGTPIVTTQGGVFSSALVSANTSMLENPVVSALRFFTEFSKPDKDAYSWNPSLPMSRTMFETGNLALYFGYASEQPSISDKNPHLNFDVAIVPQAGSVGQASVKLTVAQIQGIAPVKGSKNPQGAQYAALLLSGKDSVAAFASLSGLPPVRRDLISSRPTNAAQSVFYDSALISRSWYDPSPEDSDNLFASMFDGITSGRILLSEALTVAQSGIDGLLGRYKQQ